MKKVANVVVPKSGWCVGNEIKSCDWDHHSGSRDSVQSCWKLCEAGHGSDLGALNFIHDIRCCCVDECFECSGGPIYTIAVRNDRWVPETCGNWPSEQIACTPGGPDLVVDEEELRATVADEWLVGENSCWIAEGCLGGMGKPANPSLQHADQQPGMRGLLHRCGAVRPEELPSLHPGFVYNECHGHYH